MYRQVGIQINIINNIISCEQNGFEEVPDKGVVK